MKIHDFVIVGSGVGGLYLANYFEKRGLSYVLVEESERVGGRINTRKFDDITFELGAARVISSQKRVMQLIKKLDIGLEEQVLSDSALFWNGSWHPSHNQYLEDHICPNPISLFDELCKENGIHNISDFKLLAPLFWDDILTKDWLDEKGVPFSYAKCFFLGDIDVNMEQITLYESMFFYVSNLNDEETKFYRLKGGMVSLLDGMMKGIQAPKLCHKVNAVKAHEDSILVFTQNQTFEAKNLIFTCSLAALSKIDLPNFAKNKVFDCLKLGHYGKSIKGIIKLKKDFFPKVDYMITENPLRMLRRSAYHWEFYLPTLINPWNDSKLMDVLCQCFGELNISDVQIQNYNQEPFYGCYWNYKSGHFHNIFNAAKTSELQKRIYSVGEHFSLNPNWIEGTLESVENFLNNCFE